ncbi:MAG TPA: DUF2231 domain-containing protein, partial [Methylomirabilota bacterium]|nr:DUF2231 domain-containing protein [Methylomirabilota bacterium]
MTAPRSRYERRLLEQHAAEQDRDDGDALIVVGSQISVAHAMQRYSNGRICRRTEMAQTPARIGKHPIHPMLVVLPLGLWIAALAFDIVFA